MNTKILVIDDDVEFLEELSCMLSSFGYIVVCLSDSSQILEKIEQIHPDIILLDLYMPGVDCFQVTNELHFSSQFFNIPVIVMSGHFSGLFVSLLERAGVKRYFHKPFDPLDLAVCVEELIYSQNYSNNA